MANGAWHHLGCLAVALQHGFGGLPEMTRHDDLAALAEDAQRVVGRPVESTAELRADATREVKRGPDALVDTRRRQAAAGMQGPGFGAGAERGLQRPLRHRQVVDPDVQQGPSGQCRVVQPIQRRGRVMGFVKTEARLQPRKRPIALCSSPASHSRTCA
jgi:hypothetical protein